MSGYTIGEYAIDDPRADDYLLTLGRAMHLCAMFEHKSRALVTTLRTLEGAGPSLVLVNDLDDLLGIGRHPEEDEVSAQAAERWRLRELTAIAETQKQPLARVLSYLHRTVDGDPDGIEKLSEARKARNWIAHSAGIVFLSGSQSWAAPGFITSFRNAVLLLAFADALMSELTWIEPEGWHSVGPPEEYSIVYPELAVTWVFEKIWDLLPLDDLPAWRPHPVGPHERLREHLAGES